jgi:hypothetical protein
MLLYIPRIYAYLNVYLVDIRGEMPIEFKIKVVKVGNSLRITLPKPACEALELIEGTTVGVSMTDHELRVRKL